MSGDETTAPPTRPDHLASLLRQARVVSGLSVRAAAAQAHISSTYLSQLEAGTIKEPSPRVLHSLATIYGDSYADFMRAAGYIVPGTDGRQSQPESHALDVALRTTSPLTDDERRALSDYLAWYRWSRGHPPEKR